VSDPDATEMHNKPGLFGPGNGWGDAM